jgi:hypothetical protein
MDKYEYKYRKYKDKYLNAKYRLEHDTLTQIGGLANYSDKLYNSDNSDKLDNDTSDKLDNDLSEESDQFTEDKYEKELRKISDKFFERPKVVVKPTSHKKWKKFIDTFKKKYKVTKDAIEFTHGNVRTRVLKSKYFDVIIKYNNITIKINIEDVKKRKKKFSTINKFVKKLGYDIDKNKTVKPDSLVFVSK